MPEISADGKLMTPLLVIFREPKHIQKFHDELAEFENLRCYQTTSGKVDRLCVDD
jgi:hypothetical protein